MEQACLDGAVMPAGEARVPATDDGVLRGDGVFEVIRVYDGRPFALEDHLARLERSAANLGLAIDVEAVRRDVGALLASKPDHDGVLRLVLTRGGRRLALTEPLPDRPPLARLATVTYAPTRILDGVKSLSYAANMLATRVAVDRGFDDALLVTPHGRVLEAPTSSFFWVRDGELLTPPLDDHILASITRARVIELTGAREAVCPLDELDAAQEAFVASTVREVMPVGAIDDRELPTLGPRTRDAARLLRERIDAELQAALP